MNKKMTIIILLGTMILSLVGCSFTDNADNNDKNGNSINMEIKEDTPLKLSDSWEDLQIEIEGKIYTLPFDVKELSEDFEIDTVSTDFKKVYEDINKCSTVLQSGDILSIISISSKTTGMEYAITVQNKTDSEQPVKNCKVINLGHLLSDSKLGANDKFEKIPKFKIPGGFKFGMTVDEIKELYGEPYSDNTFEREDGICGSLLYLHSNETDILEISLWYGKTDGVYIGWQ